MSNNGSDMADKIMGIIGMLVGLGEAEPRDCDGCVLRWTCPALEERLVLPDDASELARDLYAAAILQRTMIEALREDIRAGTHDAPMVVGAVVAIAEGGDSHEFVRAALWLGDEIQGGGYEYTSPLLILLAAAWADEERNETVRESTREGTEARRLAQKICEAVAYGKGDGD